MDSTVDLPTLHRRMRLHARRRATARVGLAGAGVAAMAGGLFVVRNQTAPAGTTAVLPASTPAATPPTMPACADVPARAQGKDPADGAEAAKQADANGGAGATTSLGKEEFTIGFKGIVTLTSVDGDQLAFTIDDPQTTPAGQRTALIDADTEWRNADVTLDAPAALTVGQTVGIATEQTADGVDHVLVVDLSGMDKPDTVATIGSGPTEETASAEELAAKKAAAGANVAADAEKSATLASEAVSVESPYPAGVTDKSPGKISAVDGSTVTVEIGDVGAATIDLTVTSAFVGDTRCEPGVLTTGTQVGVLYHFDGTTAVVDGLLLDS
jgi:hypothetical protein